MARRLPVAVSAVLVLVGIGIAAAVALAETSTSGSPSATAASAPRLVPVARGLSSPVYVTQAPGEPNRLYVVEQQGTIRIVEKGKLRSAPFLDIRSRVVAGGEQGLLGLAFPKNYAATKAFYVNYSAAGSGDTVIDRYLARNGRAVLESRRQILTVAQPYANHNGGHLAFGPDGKLWVGLGDGGSGGDPENRAQDRTTLLGKLFTLDVTKRSPAPRLVAIGLRNPWRYSFDRANGDLWIGDVGQNALEEVNVLRRATRTTGLVNFGWDVYEGRDRFEDKALGPGRLIQPITQYGRNRGSSITGGYVYRGPGVPALRGRYVYGDFVAGSIFSIPTRGGDLRIEPVRVENLSSFGEGLDGTLYAVSFSGTIYRFG